MTNTFKFHHERQDDLVADSKTIMDAAKEEQRDLTATELEKIKINSHDFNKSQAMIKVRETLADQEAELKRRPRVNDRAKQARLSDTHGFRAFGDFVAAVKTAGMHGGQIDGRLKAAAASTYGNESSGTDGGFAVPPDFNESIMAKAFGEDSLMVLHFTVLSIPSRLFNAEEAQRATQRGTQHGEGTTNQRQDGPQRHTGRRVG
jgi:HK97 family phage major capsid protein